MAGDWERVTKDIEWAQRDGFDVDINGRGKMKTAVRQGNVNYMGMYKQGFYECQDQWPVRANFEACCDENQGRVYNIGRRTDGLPDV